MIGVASELTSSSAMRSSGQCIMPKKKPEAQGSRASMPSSSVMISSLSSTDDRIKTALGGQRGLDFVEANVEQLEDAVVFGQGGGIAFLAEDVGVDVVLARVLGVERIGGQEAVDHTCIHHAFVVERFKVLLKLFNKLAVHLFFVRHFWSSG